MIKLNNLKLAPDQFGSRSWLTGVTPVHAYADGKRTDAVTGYRYEICLPDMALEKISVRIDGAQQVEAPEQGYVPVSFTGLEFYVMWSQGDYRVGARASGIQVANTKA